MRWLIVTLCVIMCAGCVTYRDKVAYKRAELGFAARAAEGDDLAAAQAGEVAEANRDTGADLVPAIEAPLDAAASRDNGRAIAQARAGRAALVQFVVDAAKGAASQWPGVGALIGLAGGLAIALRKLLQYRKVAETVIEGVGATNPSGGVVDVKKTIRTLAVDYGIQPMLDKLVQKVDP